MLRRALLFDEVEWGGGVNGEESLEETEAERGSRTRARTD
jgi:hypothetical protein